MELWPAELLLKIFESLAIDDLLVCESVCLRWRDIIQNSATVWRRILSRFGRSQIGRLKYEAVKALRTSDVNSASTLRDSALRLHDVSLTSAFPNWAAKKPVTVATRDLGPAKCLGIVVDFTRQLCAIKVKDVSAAPYAPLASTIVICRLSDLSEVTRFACPPLALLVGLIDGLILIRTSADHVSCYDWRPALSVDIGTPSEVSLLTEIDVRGFDCLRVCGSHLFVLYEDLTLKAYFLPRVDQKSYARPVIDVTPLVFPPLGIVEAIWSYPLMPSRSVVYILNSFESTQKRLSRLMILTLDGRHVTTERSIVLDESFMHLHAEANQDTIDVEPKMEQRLLLLSRNHEKRHRLAIDLRHMTDAGPLSAAHVMAINNHLRPLKNQSRRWLFLFDLRSSTLEVRDSEDGAVVIPAQPGGGHLYESGVGDEEFIDVDAVNYFDADDFSIVFASLMNDFNKVEVLDFY